jgi:FAD/FMN-containing dehydrogenase
MARGAFVHLDAEACRVRSRANLDSMKSVSGRLITELSDIVGRRSVMTDPNVVAGHVRDWTGRFTGHADAVVFPATTEHVARIVTTCAAADVAVVPQGGNTGLVGGGIAYGGVVVSARRLNGLSIDVVESQVIAGAGVTIAALQHAAVDVGLRYAVDLASREVATVGGTIATNAGGTRVLRFGGTRTQVIGVEAVLADGSVASQLRGLTRDNTGYHLPSLLCGSEGTLAVITAARLRLVPVHPRRTVALLTFDMLEAALAASSQLASAPFVESVEFMLPSGVELVRRVTGLPPVLVAHSGALLLIEAASPADTDNRLIHALEQLDGMADAVLADDAADRRRLWEYRERHSESIATLGPVHKLDVALPAASLAQFIDAVPEAVAERFPAAQVWLFGHVADGNVHVNVSGVAPEDDEVDGVVLRLTASLGGSISAEHGVGRAKRRWLHLTRSPAELRAIAAVKVALDPHKVLNPGVLIPGDDVSGGSGQAESRLKAGRTADGD